MSQEKVRAILSHVDMSKIDLSSFKLSQAKFDELAHLYRNRVILSCISVILHKDEYTEEEVKTAHDLVKAIVETPNRYSYEYVYAAERQSVDNAINDITTNRNKSINDVKLKAIEKRIKDAYKTMRNLIELALENGNDFDDEFDDAIAERCLQIAKNAIESGQRKAAEERVEATAVVDQQTEQVERTSDVEAAETVVLSEDIEQNETAPKTKVSFWKRMLGRV